MKQDHVTRYFDQNARQWATHYQRGNLPLQLFNMMVRRGLKQRWNVTMKHALPAQGKTYLDVGCGTGIYSVTLAKAGAKQVIGVDSAPQMIVLSEKSAAEENLTDQCQFILGYFMELNFEEKFDLVFAMGVFDYVEDHESFWQKMISLSKGKVIGSFPGYSWPRAHARKYRYQRKGLSVYFYHQPEVEALGEFPGLTRYEVDVFGAGYVLTGMVS